MFLYTPESCAVFRRVRDPLGPLSNMAPGYPLVLGPVLVASSEHCYQASKLPAHLRGSVLAALGGRAAKVAAYDLRASWHPFWIEHRASVMQWVLATKLLQHAPRLLPVLLSTADLEIVEWSREDPYWGAVPTDTGRLAGENVLGRLWSELRAVVQAGGLGAVAELGKAPQYFSESFTWPAPK